VVKVGHRKGVHEQLSTARLAMFMGARILARGAVDPDRRIAIS